MNFSNYKNKFSKPERKEKLAKEIRLMEELLKGIKERDEILKKIWVLNATYLERWKEKK